MSEIKDPSITNYTNLSKSFKIANETATPNSPLSAAQLSAIDLSVSMNPNNANNYPSWVLDQYAQQKGISRGTLPKGTDFVPSTTTSRDVLPAVTTPPSNYQSRTESNTQALKNEIKSAEEPENIEEQKIVQNTTKALELELPKLDNEKSKQLAFSGNINKLRDCMVFVLYSPSSNENPNLSNSPLKANQVIGETVSSVTSELGTVVEGFDTGVAGIDRFKNDATKTLRDIANTKEVSSGEIERLNETFYTDESDSKTDKKLTIFMPLPKQITDQHNHEMDGFSNNPVQLAAGLVITGLNSLSGSGGAGSDGGTTKVIAPGLGQYIMNNLQLASRKTFNPAVETLYRSPSVRNWQWTFEYSPTSRQEADDFVALISKFKEHSYPTQDVGGILYTFPGTIDFYFRINGQESTVLPKSLQKCFIKGVQVDYTQQGFYTHFKDGNPVNIVLTLDIAETRLLSRSDLQKTSMENEERILDDAIAQYDKND